MYFSNTYVKEEGRRKKEEGRGKREEGRGKREEGKKEERKARCMWKFDTLLISLLFFPPSSSSNFLTAMQLWTQEKSKEIHALTSN